VEEFAKKKKIFYDELKIKHIYFMKEGYRIG